MSEEGAAILRYSAYKSDRQLSAKSMAWYSMLSRQANGDQQKFKYVCPNNNT